MRKMKYPSPKKVASEYTEVAKSNAQWTSNLRSSPGKNKNMNFSIERKKSLPVIKEKKYFTARNSSLILN